jgi:hypothetical protein
MSIKTKYKQVYLEVHINFLSHVKDIIDFKFFHEFCKIHIHVS